MVRARWLPIGLSLALAGASLAREGSAAGPPALTEAQVVPLPGVERRIDHMALAPVAKWLYVSALGNHSLEVIDVGTGTRVASLPNVDEPQGVAVVSSARTVVAARGGTVTAVASASDPAGHVSLKASATVATTMDDADNVRVDKASGLAYVGYGEGALGVIDPATMTKTADIPLPGHPESFQLEQAGPRIYVNVPRTHEVVVVDRTSRATVAHFALGSLASNYPMSLDEAGHRLFVGVRQPARLVVLDTASGKELAVVPCVGDTDDLFFDARRQRVYVIGGEGYVDVFDASPSGGYARVARMTTRAGARTGLWSPDLDRLYVAWPARDGHPAEIHTLAPPP
jgi:DNA-binding beta-propeller fold protein YncE